MLHPVGPAEIGWPGPGSAPGGVLLPAVYCPSGPIQVPGLTGHCSATQQVTPRHALEQLESTDLVDVPPLCLRLTTLAFKAFSGLIKGHKAQELGLHS